MPGEQGKCGDWVPIFNHARRNVDTLGMAESLHHRAIWYQANILWFPKGIFQSFAVLSGLGVKAFFTIIGTQAYFFSNSDASTLQGVDVFSAIIHKAAYEPIVAEDDAGHLGDVLMTLAFCDVSTVVHQAGHQIAFPSLLICALFQLKD